MSFYNLLELVERFFRKLKYWENFFIFLISVQWMPASMMGDLRPSSPVSVHTKYELNSHLLIEFFIFILSCEISHVLRSIQYCAKVFINGSEVSAIFSRNQTRQAQTQRFPDWLIRKYHPIREEETAWQLQAGTPKITHASMKLRMPDFRYFFRSSASSFGRNSSWNNYAKT